MWPLTSGDVFKMQTRLSLLSVILWLLFEESSLWEFAVVGKLHNKRTVLHLL